MQARIRCAERGVSRQTARKPRNEEGVQQPLDVSHGLGSLAKGLLGCVEGVLTMAHAESNRGIQVARGGSGVE